MIVNVISSREKSSSEYVRALLKSSCEEQKVVSYCPVVIYGGSVAMARSEVTS